MATGEHSRDMLMEIGFAQAEIECRNMVALERLTEAVRMLSHSSLHQSLIQCNPADAKTDSHFCLGDIRFLE